VSGWYLAGEVAGLGIRKAVASAAERARVKQAMDPRGAAVPRPLLDIDRVITDRYFFQMGVPWGWRNPGPAEVAYWAAQVGLPVVAGVIAERTDEDWVVMLVSPVPMDGEGLSSLIMEADELQRARFSKFPNGHPLGSPQKVLIGGELGLIFHFINDVPGASRGYPSVPAVPVTTTECYFVRRGSGLMFRVEFTAGSAYHERYMPCLWTMLGSWHWLK